MPTRAMIIAVAGRSAVPVASSPVSRGVASRAASVWGGTAGWSSAHTPGWPGCDAWPSAPSDARTSTSPSLPSAAPSSASTRSGGSVRRSKAGAWLSLKGATQKLCAALSRSLALGLLRRLVVGRQLAIPAAGEVAIERRGRDADAARDFGKRCAAFCQQGAGKVMVLLRELAWTRTLFSQSLLPADLTTTKVSFNGVGAAARRSA